MRTGCVGVTWLSCHQYNRKESEQDPGYVEPVFEDFDSFVFLQSDYHVYVERETISTERIPDVVEQMCNTVF